MGFQPRQPGDTSKSIRGETQSAFGYLRRQIWTDPVAVDADRILNDQALDGSTVTTFLAQPDFARIITAVASGATTDNLVINGTNIRGETITETVALNGTTPVASTKAFKTITSIVVPTVGATTIDVGVSDAMGLDRCMNGNEVILATLDGVYETTRPTVTFHASDVSKNTVDPNTALNAAKDLAVVYVSTEKTAKLGTTA